MDFQLIPSSINRTHFLEELNSSLKETTVVVYGWAEQIRLLGKFSVFFLAYTNFNLLLGREKT